MPQVALPGIARRMVRRFYKLPSLNALGAFEAAARHSSLSFAAAELMAASLPDARLHGFEGKGHLPLFTATQEFCEVLRSFVRDVIPTT